MNISFLLGQGAGSSAMQLRGNIFGVPFYTWMVREYCPGSCGMVLPDAAWGHADVPSPFNRQRRVVVYCEVNKAAECGRGTWLFDG
jgi:hypothetical protein